MGAQGDSFVFDSFAQGVGWREEPGSLLCCAPLNTNSRHQGKQASIPRHWELRVLAWVCARLGPAAQDRGPQRGSGRRGGLSLFSPQQPRTTAQVGGCQLDLRRSPAYPRQRPTAG